MNTNFKHIVSENTSTENTSAENTSTENTSAENTSAENTSEENTTVKNSSADNTMKNIIVFKTISMFVKELGNFYGKMFKNVNLYMHLINRTTFSLDLAIQKHVEAFKDFCNKNIDSIIESNYKTFKKNTVKYSKKVYINFQMIFEKTESLDTLKTIWKYLQIISMHLVPGYKEILKDKFTKQSTTSPLNEEDFLEDIIKKIESNVKITDTGNPMEAVTNIMQSGLFTDMMSGMNSGFKNGTLDIKNMPSAIHKIISKLNHPNDSSNKEFSKMKNTMESMIGIMNQSSSSSGNPVPDMMGLMSMLMPEMNQSPPHKQKKYLQ